MVDIGNGFEVRDSPWRPVGDGCYCGFGYQYENSAYCVLIRCIFIHTDNYSLWRAMFAMPSIPQVLRGKRGVCYVCHLPDASEEIKPQYMVLVILARGFVLFIQKG